MHNPLTKAIEPENTEKTLTNYRNAQKRGMDEYSPMVQRFYELITDYYEFGWGPSFHFAPAKRGETFEESITNHQYFLGNEMGLQPKMDVLDVGCGVGGPQRSIAEKFGSTITGLNISAYQLSKCEAYNKEAGLEDRCHVLLGDFMEIPAGDQSFDAAYHIEAIPHAPNKETVYAEIFRVLKPGAIFAGYDWCMTPLYNADNPDHQTIKKRIEYGNALPQIASFEDVNNALRAVGFEQLETIDRAAAADPDLPWYRPLEGNVRTLKGLPRSSVGRTLTSMVLRVLESVRAVPKGAYETCEILNIAADSLIAGGRLGIFTPMYYHKARKPN